MDIERELKIVTETLDSIKDIKALNGGSEWDFFICNMIRSNYVNVGDVVSYIEVHADLPDLYNHMKKSPYWDHGVLTDSHITKNDTSAKKHLEIRIDLLTEYIEVLKEKMV